MCGVVKYGREDGSFLSFVRQYHSALLLLAGFLLFSLGPYLWSSNYRIDSTIFIVRDHYLFNDIDLGRFGIVLFNRLLLPGAYNPYLTAFLTLLAVAASAVFFVFMLWRLCGAQFPAAAFVLPVVCFLHPVWTEQLYFTYQSFPVVFSLLLCFLSVFLLFHSAEAEKAVQPLLGAVCCLFIALSVYQAFAPVFIALVAGAAMLERLCRERESRFFLCVILRSIAVLAAGLLLYAAGSAVAVAFWGEETEYLSRQILWGASPLYGVLISIMRSIGALLFCAGVADTPGFTISLVFSGICIFLRTLCRQERDWFLPLCWLFLQLTPFALVIISGSRTELRAELTVPLVIAFNFCAAILCLRQTFQREGGKRAFLAGLCAALCPLFVLYMQAQTCFRMYYTDDVRYEQDAAFAGQILRELEKQGLDDSRPLVFVGEHPARLNDVCLDAGVIGSSFFSYHETALATNTIMLDFLNVFGYHFADLTQAQIVSAHERADAMRSWPDASSLRIFDDMTVIKLSGDPYWDAEILQPGYRSAAEEQTDVSASRYRAIVTSVSVDDQSVTLDGRVIRWEEEIVSVAGWCYIPGVPSRETRTDVLLKDSASGELQTVNTARTIRRDVTKTNWRDGVDYDQSGFRALFPLAFLEENPDTLYQVILRCERNGETVYVPTAALLSYRALVRK